MPEERKLSFYLDMCSFAFDLDPLHHHGSPIDLQPSTPSPEAAAVNEEER
jgi:hypothetical protein